jgi:hypothetical protein
MDRSQALKQGSGGIDVPDHVSLGIISSGG